MRTTLLLTLGLLLTNAGWARSQDSAATFTAPLIDMTEEPRPEPVVWARGEYLLWWIKDGGLATPLVTVGSQADPVPGGLGQPGTLIALGASDTDFGVRSGGRFTVGAWLDSDQIWGLETNYLFLCDNGVDQAVSSSGLPGSATLALPFFDPVTNSEASTFIANPPTFAGTAIVSQTSRLQGTEINGLANLTASSRLRIDLLGGFRYLHLRETLALSTSSPFVPPLPQDVFATRDEFTTRNNFYGGQLGARAEYFTGRVFLNAAGKVALGSVEQSANITGGLLTNDFNGFGTPQTFPGGYLALPSNIGVYRRSRFAVVPEVDINAGYQFRRGTRLFIGYTFLYASAVARPGDQIDRVINQSQGVAFNSNPNATLAGPARPAFSFSETSFWAQGINFGLEFRY